MHDMAELEYDLEAVAVQPWLANTQSLTEQQRSIQELLARRAGARFGSNCYVAPHAKVFTHRLTMGDRSWIAAGAIIRGNVEMDADCSVNSYAHIAGAVRIGRGCRIASLASIYGFNHGTRPDKFVKDQAITSKGIILGEDIWVGANAIILDGVELGDHCIIAAGAVVTKSFPAYQLLAGNPARIIGDRRDKSDNNSSVDSTRSDLKVRSLLFENDPYNGLSTISPEDLQGWGSNEQVFEDVLKEIRPKLIVEVGTWKGASAIHMANLCKKLALDAELVCIDTWLGNWQHWARTTGTGSRVDLQLTNGHPQLYFQFLSNVIAKGHRDIITPLPLTSIAGAKLFAHYQLHPDLVYIDGDHEYEAIIFDLRAWLGLISETGLLVGDDYSWPGVKKAVEEIGFEGVWKPCIIGNKFVLRRVGTGAD